MRKVKRDNKVKRVRLKRPLVDNSESISNGANGGVPSSIQREKEIRNRTRITPEGRDRRGRFAKGWKGGPGNPALKRLADYKKAVNAAINPWELHELMRTLLHQALKKGDIAAARVLLDRALGRVPIDITLEAVKEEEPNVDDRFL